MPVHVIHTIPGELLGPEGLRRCAAIENAWHIRNKEGVLDGAIAWARDRLPPGNGREALVGRVGLLVQQAFHDQWSLRKFIDVLDFRIESAVRERGGTS